MIVIAAIVFGTIGYFKLKNSKKPKADALDYLPANCLLYFKTNDFIELNTKINGQSLLVDKLCGFKEVERLATCIQRFADLAESNEAIKEELEDAQFHFALYQTNFDWLVSFNLHELGNQNYFSERLTAALSSKQEKNYWAFEIKPYAKMYYHLTDGVVLFSSSSLLIDKAIDPAEKKLPQQGAFKKYKSSMEEEQGLSLFVNHAIYKMAGANSILQLNQFSDKGFSTGQLEVEPSQLIVNGDFIPDSLEKVHAFLDQLPAKLDFLDVLPSNAAEFTAYGFNDYVKLKTTLSLNTPSSSSGFWLSVNDSAMYDVAVDFYANVNTELIEFETKGSASRVLLCSLKDTVKALEHLNFMSDSNFVLNGRNVFELRKGKDEPELFQPLSNYTSCFALLYDDFLFLAANHNAVSELIAYLNRKSFLSGEESFNTYQNKHFPDNFNVLVYCSPQLMSSATSKVLNLKGISKEKIYEQFKHFSYSLVAKQDEFAFRWHLLHESNLNDSEQDVLWTLNLDTVATTRAEKFINHVSSENELLIQDEAKNLYLIDAKGKIIWKKRLNEKILSKMYTVDLFKNGKFQVFFNSANYLHLIDRKGNYVEGYPIKAPSEITSGVSIFDYENTKDYRLFFACNNNKIYNYSLYGIKQEGFIPFKTEARVNLPLQYTKVGQSDYIVAVDVEGKIYTISRKGVGRIGLTNRTTTDCGAFYIDAAATIHKTYLYYVDAKSNIINKISFSDRKEIVQLKLTGEQRALVFNLIDENPNMDMLITTNEQLGAFNLNGNKLFEKNNDKGFSSADYYSDGSSSFYFGFSAMRNELVLFDQLKSTTKPLKASAGPLIFDLFKDNKTYLIYPDRAQLNCLAY